jgi:hypothetical protein
MKRGNGKPLMLEFAELVEMLCLKSEGNCAQNNHKMISIPTAITDREGNPQA